MAAIESNYEMHVTKATGRMRYNQAPEYEHVCRIELGGGLRDRMLKKAELIKARFPESEGFRVSMTYWECMGKGIVID